MQPIFSDLHPHLAGLSPAHLQTLLLVESVPKQARTLAIEISRRLNCVGDEPGMCSNCRRLASGNYGDFVVLEPDQKSSLGIEAIRGLSKKLQLKPQAGGSIKLCYIWADALTPEAQNALLKLTEEPPPQTLVILAATRPDRLLSTIRSRARTIRLAQATHTQPGELADHAAKLLAQSSFERLITVKRLLDEHVAPFAITEALQRNIIARGSYSQATSNALAALERCRLRLHHNVTPRPALEQLVLEVGAWN